MIEMLEVLGRPSRYGYRSPLHRMVRIWCPYTFTTLAGELLLPLNRLYKPLGISQPWIDYSYHCDQAVAADSLNLVAAPIKSSQTHSTGHCEVFLYSDSTAPWLSGGDRKRYLQALRDVLDPTYKPNLEN